MNPITEFLNSSFGWFYSNIKNIIFSTIAIVIIYVFYKFSIRQITKLRDQEKLDESASFILKRIFVWGSILILAAFIIAQFGIRIDLIAGLLVLAGGTVIGFASMSTLGNAIAGLILMISRPFRIGDRILFNGQFADVETVDLIYTRMRTTDNILLSVPNQELIQSEIDNYGKDRIVRRRCSITAGYELTADHVENALIEAADKIEEVLIDPPPYVWVTEFKDYAIEYTLFVFINEIKRVQEIDAKLRKTVLETCNKHNIDISTPSLIRSVQ